MKPTRKSYVYFISSDLKDDAAPIKIGYSVNPFLRLKSLNCTHHRTMGLLAVMPGTRKIEQGFHRKFKKDWLRGEWFRASKAIKDQVAKINAYHPLPNFEDTAIADLANKPSSYTRKELIGIIEKHLRRTGESPYSFGKRVLGDISFVWKLKNGTRQPWQRTVDIIIEAIAEDVRNRPKKSRAR